MRFACSKPDCVLRADHIGRATDKYLRTGKFLFKDWSHNNKRRIEACVTAVGVALQLSPVYRPRGVFTSSHDQAMMLTKTQNRHGSSSRTTI